MPQLTVGKNIKERRSIFLFYIISAIHEPGPLTHVCRGNQVVWEPLM